MRNPLKRRCRCTMCKIQEAAQEAGWVVVIPSQAVDQETQETFGLIVGDFHFVNYVLKELEP
jgi:RNase P protein component